MALIDIKYLVLPENTGIIFNSNLFETTIDYKCEIKDGYYFYFII